MIAYLIQAVVRSSHIECEGAILEHFLKISSLIVSVMILDNRRDEIEAHFGCVNSHDVDTIQEKLSHPARSLNQSTLDSEMEGSFRSVLVVLDFLECHSFKWDVIKYAQLV